MYGMDIEDIEEGTPKFQEQVQLYIDVDDKICESLQLYADYEESYLIYKAALPDPALAKKGTEEESMKEALAQQLEEEEAL